MKKKNLTGTALWRGLSAVLLLLLLLTVHAGAESGGETEYIVKYNENAAQLFDGDSAAPFRVVTSDELSRLLAEDLLEWYEPDGRAYMLDLLPEDRTAAVQGTLSTWYTDETWQLDMISAETAYEKGAVGEGIRVAVIDSGANMHPDLEGCLGEGRNYIRNDATTEDGIGHGTAVCGLIAGGGENGMVGPAPKATIIPLKCFDGNTTKVSAVCQAIWDAVDEFHCDVINMSLGILDDSVTLREAINHAVENGVIVVSAVGNNGSGVKYYPAAYEEVIGVGNVDSTGAVYKNSNHNDSVFITAPGTGVVSLGRLEGYTTFTGCSFSTPLVTGAVADILSIKPDLSPKDVSELLSSTATDKGNTGWDEYYGWGILNLQGCVLALEQGSDLPQKDEQRDNRLRYQPHRYEYRQIPIPHQRPWGNACPPAKDPRLPQNGQKVMPR